MYHSNGATEISLSAHRVLAVLLKPVELVPDEDAVRCVHLKRPVLMVKPPNLSKITKLKGTFFVKQPDWRQYLHPL